MQSHSVDSSIPAESVGEGLTVGSIVLRREIHRDPLRSLWFGEDHANGKRRVLVRFLPSALHGDRALESELDQVCRAQRTDPGHPGVMQLLGFTCAARVSAHAAVVPAAATFAAEESTLLAAMLESRAPAASAPVRDAEAAWAAKELAELLESVHCAGPHGAVDPHTLMIAGSLRKSLIGARFMIFDAEVAWRAARGMRLQATGATATWAEEARAALAAADAYSAPEVRRGAAPSVRSDVYSLAAVICKIVTGAAPREDASLDSMSAGVLRSTLERALRSDPSQRPRDAAEFLQWAGIRDLPEESDGAPESAPPPAEACWAAQPEPPAPPPQQTATSSRAAALAAAGWICALGFGGALAWKYMHPTPDAALAAQLASAQESQLRAREEADHALGEWKAALGTCEALKSAQASAESRLAAAEQTRKELETQLKAAPTPESAAALAAARDSAERELKETQKKLSDNQESLGRAKSELQAALASAADLKLQLSGGSAADALRAELDQERKRRAETSNELSALRTERDSLRNKINELAAAAPPAPAPMPKPPARPLAAIPAFASARLVEFGGGAVKIVENGSRATVRAGVLAWSTEVTRGQFRAFCSSKRRAFPDQPSIPPAWRKLVREDDLPVVNVSSADARAFCDWLCEQAGPGFRLPTEAEWTLVATESGKAAGALPAFASTLHNPELVLNSLESPSSEKGRHERSNGAWPAASNFPDSTMLTASELADVATAPANGMSHICGNVWEWCADGWYSGDGVADGYLDAADPLMPIDRNAALGTVRGGSWLEPRHKCTFYSRKPMKLDAGAVDVGFRPIWSPTVPKPR